MPDDRPCSPSPAMLARLEAAERAIEDRAMERIEADIDPPLCRFGPGGEYVREYTPVVKETAVQRYLRTGTCGDIQ